MCMAVAERGIGIAPSLVVQPQPVEGQAAIRAGPLGLVSPFHYIFQSLAHVVSSRLILSVYQALSPPPSLPINTATLQCTSLCYARPVLHIVLVGEQVLTLFELLMSRLLAAAQECVIFGRYECQSYLY